MTSAQFLAAFAQALRRARQKKGLTQEAVSEAASIHPTYASRVETGMYTPTIAVAFRLSHAVDRTFWSLVKEAEDGRFSTLQESKTVQRKARRRTHNRQ
jgi:transcriptional regulator with XRE-family HTH domain